VIGHKPRVVGGIRRAVSSSRRAILAVGEGVIPLAFPDLFELAFTLGWSAYVTWLIYASWFQIAGIDNLAHNSLLTTDKKRVEADLWLSGEAGSHGPIKASIVDIGPNCTIRTRGRAHRGNEVVRHFSNLGERQRGFGRDLVIAVRC
jgi:hypothetical protein